MTTQSKREKLSKLLMKTSQINSVLLNHYDFDPTLIGNGPYVTTSLGDVLFDLRLSKQRPYCGHSHPIIMQHEFDELSNQLLPNFYSVPQLEYLKMIETFQVVSFEEILKANFQITYHNIVINFDENLLNFDTNEVFSKLESLIANNRNSYFWLVENDLNLLSSNQYFYFQKLMENEIYTKHIHLVGVNHFISSVFIQSHHLFSEDSNIQIFLGFKKYIEEVISTQIAGKNKIDFEIIDNFLQENKIQVQRKSRYLIPSKPVDKSRLEKNGILTTSSSDNTTDVLSIPIACTNNELLDILKRLKLSL